jgi:hypothetical protein
LILSTPAHARAVFFPERGEFSRKQIPRPSRLEAQRRRKEILTAPAKHFDRHVLSGKVHSVIVSMAVIKGVSLTALIGASIGYWRHPESRCISLFHDQASRPPTDDEVNWRAEFAKTGAIQVRQNLLNPAIYNSQPKRIFALQWLREKECAAELREQRTLWAAIATVIVGIFSIVVTLLH